MRGADGIALAAQGFAYAIHGAEQVHQKRNVGAFWPLKEQRRPSFAHDALTDFRNFQYRIDLGLNPL